MMMHGETFYGRTTPATVEWNKSQKKKPEEGADRSKDWKTASST